MRVNLACCCLALALGAGLLACGGEQLSVAEPCEVREREDGARELACPDGSTAVLSDGRPGGSCVVEEEDDQRWLRCDDGSEYLFLEERCVPRLTDGGVEVDCEASDPVLLPLAGDCSIWEGGATIRNLWQWRVFVQAGCAEIRGNLILDGLPLEDLRGLEGLSRVEGILVLRGNPQLQSLQGLESLESVEIVSLQENRELEDISALEEVALRGFYLSDSPQLEDISALAGRAELPDGLSLSGLGIPDLLALQELEEALRVTLGELTEVQSLAGLEALTEVQFLDIVAMSGLEDLQGLEGLERVGAALRIVSNPGLTSLDGLENLQSLGLTHGGEFPLPTLEISSNSQLPTCLAEAFRDRFGPEELLGTVEIFLNSTATGGCP